MNPQKRTRRGRVRREVGTEALPAKRVSRLKKKPVVDPAEPTKRTRKPHVRRKRKGA